MRPEDYAREMHRIDEILKNFAERADQDGEIDFGDWRRLDNSITIARQKIWEWLRYYRERYAGTTHEI